MKKAAIIGGALAALLILAAVVVRYRALQRGPAAKARAMTPSSSSSSGEQAHESFLYGRIATLDGAAYEGRLRWGGAEEAFWGNYFNGVKKNNPWAAQVPPEQMPKQRDPFKIFGLEIWRRERPINLVRLFMARFGDIARIEAQGRDVRVTLKSGATSGLDRFGASDFDDGVRVWDPTRGVADIDSLRISSIDLLPSPNLGAAPRRLHGTVRTRQGDFTGFLQWDREQCVGSDRLNAQNAGRDLSVPFETIRSIAPRSRDSALVTLNDGRDLVLSGARDVGNGNRGVYVDDPRYGRVLVSWNAVERVAFTPGVSGPAYRDFPPGGPLMGTVTTRAGRRLTGRFVYDLDESEFSETLDAPSQGVNYTIPFGLIASIILPDSQQRPRVLLRSGEQLQLDRTGDLGEANAGMLVFTDAQQRPEYVRWTDLQRIDFHPPPATYPPVPTR